MTVMDEIFSRPPPRRPNGELYYDKRLWAKIDAARHRAHRFVFTDRASDLMGRFAFDEKTGPLILTNRQFAIPPFDTTYVEMESKTFHANTKQLVAPLESADLTIGYLTIGNEVYSFTRGVDHFSVMGLVSWEVRPPGDETPAHTNIPDLGDTVELVGGLTNHRDPDGWLRLGAALGTTMSHIDGEETRLQLLREIGIRWTSTVEINAKSVAQYLAYCAGDVRNLWTMLLWINRPSKMHFDPHPAGSRFVKGKRVAFRKHTVVDIDLNKVRVVRDAIHLDFERASPINHPVRGAFHHSGGQATGCAHDWPPMPDERGHWHCTRCGRKRWWVKEHRRGKYELGINDNDYKVSVGGQ
jgi:hypothetical protein